MGRQIAVDLPAGAKLYLRPTQFADTPVGRDGEVLRLMSAIRFTRRAQTEHGARLFSFVPPNSSYSREAAASLCSPVPSHAELNRKETP